MQDLVDMVGDGKGNGKGKKSKKTLNGPVPLTKDLVISIEDIITQKVKLKDLQDSLKDQVKGLADKMQVTTGEMNSMIANIIAERKDKETIDEKKKSIDFVEVYVEFKAKNL